MEWTDLLAALNLPQLLHGGMAVLLGLAFSQPLQAFIEHNLATKRWMPQGLKPLLPMLLSGAVAGVAQHFGISQADAVAAAAALTAGAHLVNESAALASYGTDQSPTPVANTNKTDGSGAPLVPSGAGFKPRQ